MTALGEGGPHLRGLHGVWMQRQVGWQQRSSVSTASHLPPGRAQLLVSPRLGVTGEQGCRWIVGNFERLLLQGVRNLELPMYSGSLLRARRAEESPQIAVCCRKDPKGAWGQGPPVQPARK